MNKKKILSLIMALVMLVGVFSPLTALAAEAEKVTKTVTLHKLVMSKEELGKWNKAFSDDLEKKGYNGTQNTKQLKALLDKGHSAHEVAGVYFAWQKQDGYKINDQKVLVDKDGKVIEAGITEYDKLSAANKSKAVENWVYIDKQGNKATIQEPADEKFAGAVMGGITEAGGYKFDTTKLDQRKPTTYKIVEIHSLSSYKGADGETLTDMKAVPVKITLPLVNKDGVVTDAHVYPKNTEDKPTTNKDFSEEFEDGKNGRDNGTDEKSIQNDPEKSEKEKKANWKPKNVGDTVNYTVRTTIPAKANYATAYWNDEMTDGLDLDINSVKLAYTGNEGVTLEKDKDYTIKATTNKGKQGFELEFTTAGLEKINGKDKEGVITITYSAKLNEKAVVAVPESNDVNFYYGNNPRKGNTPKPNYPDDNGKLKVTKTWADGKWAQNEKATFRIVDAQTGKTVTKDDLVGAPKDYTFEAEKEIGYKKTASAEWEYLNKNKQYKVVEVSVTYEDENGKVKTLTGWEANYVVNGKGVTEVTNYKTNNPEPLNPTEPKVVTYGAKFVKTNVEGERLPGAEFVVRDANNKYLVEGTKADRKAYEEAQAAFVKAVKEYNAKVANKKTPTPEEKANVEKLEKARDAAWNATLQSMNGFTADSKDAAGVLKLTSNELGQFEIAGLAPGTYTLVEVNAPEGYALPTNAEFEFEIKADGTISSTKMNSIDFGIKDDDANNDNAKQVINKKVTIPQTGGIGTVLFTVVGISLMAGAVIAMKKNREEA